jgi:toxin YoeB
MEIKFTPLAQEHLEFWKKSGNKQTQKKIYALLEDILKTPYQGLGNPHQLKHELSGSWSRRITLEHRLVYEIIDNSVLLITRLKGHY